MMEEDIIDPVDKEDLKEEVKKINRFLDRHKNLLLLLKALSMTAVFPLLLYGQYLYAFVLWMIAFPELDEVSRFGIKGYYFYNTYKLLRS